MEFIFAPAQGEETEGTDRPYKIKAVFEPVLTESGVSVDSYEEVSNDTEEDSGEGTDDEERTVVTTTTVIETKTASVELKFRGLETVY